MEFTVDSAQSPSPRVKRPKPSFARGKEKNLTCTSTAYEKGIEIDQAKTNGNFVETDLIAHHPKTIGKEYSDIETSLFRSMLSADYSAVSESPEENYDNIEMADSMWDEIFADASPMENDDQVNDNKSKFYWSSHYDPMIAFLD